RTATAHARPLRQPPGASLRGKQGTAAVRHRTHRAQRGAGRGTAGSRSTLLRSQPAAPRTAGASDRSESTGGIIVTVQAWLEPSSAATRFASLLVGAQLAPRAKVLRALGLGLAITVFQVFLACCLSGQADWDEAYLQLFQWDSVWYAGIADTGYATVPEMTHKDFGNVAFFPGYALSARLLRNVTGLPSRPALLLAAQLACW